MTMTKKIDQFLRHRIIGERIFLWFNISSSSSPEGKVLVDKLASFSIWSARKSKYIRFQRKIFELHLRGFLLVVVVLVVVQVRDQFVQAMRNSDPGVRIVFVYRLNSNFHSIFTLQVNGCDFQYGSNLGVPLNPSFRFRWFFISWKSVLTTCHWFCKLWEFVSVLFHEVLSDFNCFQEPCIRTIFFNRSCRESLSTRSLYFSNGSLWARSSVEGVGVFINELVGTSNGSDCPASTGLSVLTWQALYSSHKSETAP